MINKKFITFATRSSFMGEVGINSSSTEISKEDATQDSSVLGGYRIGNIPFNSIVVILDTGELWTHGKYVGGSGISVGIATNDYIPFTFQNTTYNLSLAGHNHTTLNNVANINFATASNDSCYIASAISGNATHLDFYLAANSDQESYRWLFGDSSTDVGTKTIMELFPTNDSTAALKLYDSYVATQDWVSSNYLSKRGGTLKGSLNFYSDKCPIRWTSGSWWQRIKITDNDDDTTATFSFQQSSDSGSSWKNLLVVTGDSTVIATNFSGQWCGYTNDLSTNNTSDTWVPVLTNNTIQHRVIPTAYNSDPSTLSVASATKLTTTRSLWGNDFNGDSNVSGRLLINPSNASGNYDEGIRITCNSNGWSTITLKGSDNTSDTGTSTNTWGVFNNNGNFYINKNNSSGQQAPRLWGHSNGWTIGNTSASNYTLSVGGPIYTSDCLKIGDYAYIRSGSGMRINNSDTITSKWATGTIIENRYSEASGIHMDGDGIHMWAADDGLMYYDEDSGDLCWQIDEDGYFSGEASNADKVDGYHISYSNGNLYFTT